jgi:hypothetical protein
MFTQRNLRISLTMLLLVLISVLTFHNGEAMAAATPSVIHPGKQTPIRVSAPKILPITDAEQLAILTQMFGERAKHFKIMHYTDSWTDFSNKWTSYQTIYGPTWSGYIVDILSTPYFANHVYGNFTVPPVNTGNKPNISEWAGIGGVYSNDELIQAGAGTTLRGGYPIIAAFFELYPAPPQELWEMYPGENITVGMYVTNSSNGQWNIIVSDSSGTSEVIPVTGFYPDRNTAEWIQERAPGSLNPSPIPSNSAPVYFTVANWGDQNSGISRSIQDGEVGTVRRQILRNMPPGGNNECLVPYNLNSANGASSFNTAWQSSC